MFMDMVYGALYTFTSIRVQAFCWRCCRVYVRCSVVGVCVVRVCSVRWDLYVFGLVLWRERMLKSAMTL